MRELNLKNFTSMLLRKKIMVLLIMTVFTLMGAIYSYKVVKTEYTSSVKLVFGISNEQTEERNENIEPGNKLDEKLFSTCENLIKSKGLLQKVKNTLKINLDEEYLLKSIDVKKIDKTDYIEISVKNKNQKLATDIANEIAVVFVDRIEKIYSINDIYVVESENKEGSEYTINHFRDISIFVVAGMIFTFVYISIYVIEDKKIKSVENIEKEIGLRNLVSIPIKKRNKKESISSLVIYEKSKSITKDAFETLRKNVQFSNINNKENKVMLVTSCFSAEGKSYVSANLASVFAEIGKKVILIDTDMRRGSQSGIFNIPNELGLSNYLSNLDTNGMEINERVNKYIKETEIKNLNIITSGSVPPNPSELLTLSKLPELIKELSIFYDLIILDGAPVLPITDSLILSRLANSTILVTLYNVTRKDELFKAKRDIQNVGGRIIGTVLNKAPSSNLKYENKYHYDEIGALNSANKNISFDNKTDDINKKIKRFCKRIKEKVEDKINSKSKKEIKLLGNGKEIKERFVKEDSNKEEKIRKQKGLELEKQKLREELVRQKEIELEEKKLIKEKDNNFTSYVEELEQYSMFNTQEEKKIYESKINHDQYLEDEIMFDDNSQIIEQAKLEFELEEIRRKEREAKREEKNRKKKEARFKRKEFINKVAKNTKRAYNNTKKKINENRLKRMKENEIRRKENEIRRVEEAKIREEKERIRTRENAKKQAEREIKRQELKAEKDKIRLERNKEQEVQKQIRMENKLQKKIKSEQIKEERRKYKEEEKLREKEAERMKEEMQDDNLYPKTKYNKDLM